MNYLNSIYNMYKNYIIDTNDDIYKINHESSCIDDEYIEIKKCKKRPISHNSFFTKSKINKINNLELNNKINTINYKMEKDEQIDKQFVHIIKYVGIGLLFSTVLYKHYYQCSQ